MEGWIPLAIFPEGALASSVITTVLVGVWVVVFFNLRFGWVLSGLVVPGYMAPLILIEPVSTGVIVVEAIVTYCIVRLMAVHLAQAIGWTTFFGRDRFFALIITSVGVRLVFDGLLLPQFAVWLNQNYDLGFDWTRDLESFGLIVIALYANQFWKAGLARGFFTSAVTILITLAIVRLGLMEFTNFRVSDIGYLYELLAASLVASSKAYIILILTAFIASRINLRAGLDFNGLLIPALVALQWYEPMKILTSIGEGILILAVGSLLLRSPIFANKTIEGGRKILIFFNISFAWKMILGYAVLWSGAEVNTTDTYGFGYLLSSLLALKLHDKGGAGRMLAALVAVSAQGAVYGTVVGFAFSEVSRAMGPQTEDPVLRAPVQDVLPSELLVSAVQRSAYAQQSGQRPERPNGIALQNFREGVATLVADLEPDTSNFDTLVDARRKIALAGFGVRVTSENHVVIESVVSGAARIVYLFDPASGSDLTMSLPDAQAARGLSSAAAALFKLTQARAMILHGRSEAVLSTEPGTYFHAAHEAFGGAIVQLTSDGSSLSTFEVAGRYPRNFDLNALEPLIGDISLVSGATARHSAQRFAAESGFALLNLAPDALYSLVAAVDGGDIFVEPGPGGVQRVTRGFAARNAAAGDATPPSVSDLLYMESEILAPLFAEVLVRLRRDPQVDRGMAELLLSLDVAARSVGYRLRVLHDGSRRSSHLILHSDHVSWGTFAFSFEEDRPIFVHVPSGLRDRRVLSFGLSAFQRLDAAAILVAGRMDRDGLPAPELNVLNPDHVSGLYDLIAKLLIQERTTESVSLVLRSVAAETLVAAPEAEIILSPESIFGGRSYSAIAAETVARLRSFGLAVADSQGDESFAGFEPGIIPQAGFLSARPSAEFLSLWLTPDLLDRFVDRLGQTSELALFRRLGASNSSGAVADLAGHCIAPGPLPVEVVNSLHVYLDSGNPVALQSLLGARTGLRMDHLGDLPTLQTFAILKKNSNGCLRAVVNLNPLMPDLSVPTAIASSAVSPRALALFAESRTAVLTFSGEQK